MHPIIRPQIILDKQSPISVFSLETRKACEKALSPSHVEKIRRIEHATIKCHPKQVDHQLLSQRNWVYHFLEFTLDDLKQFLKHKLSHLLNEPIECYLTGSAAQPGNRPFNNIDLTLFPKRFDYSQYKYIINLFLFNLVLSHKDYNPETSVQAFWALDLLYYDRQEEFSDGLGGLFCIRNIDSTSGPINIRIFSKPNNLSLGIAPFVSLNRYMLRLSLGQNFVENGDYFEQALLQLEKDFFYVPHPENVKHLIFPVLNKFTHFFAIEQLTFETAKFQLKKDFYDPKKQAEIEREFIHHQLNHYPFAPERAIDVLNLLFFFKYDPELCQFFAEVLLKNRRVLELQNELQFAEIIKRNPYLASDLLNFIGAVAYLDWNRNNGEGKRGERFWSHTSEVHPEKSITYTWMCYTSEQRRLRVFLPRCRSLNEVFGYIQIIHDRVKNEQELGYLRELLKCLHLDCTFLSPQGFEEIAKEMTTKKNDPKKSENDEKKEAVKENQVEETVCKALEKEKDPKGEAVRELIKMFPCEDQETLISIFQAILGLADKQLDHNSLFKLFKNLIVSAFPFKNLRQLICDTSDLFAQVNPSFFKFCLKDSELNQLIVSVVEQYPRAEYYQMLLLLAENGTGIIQGKIFEIFNQILNEDEFNPNSIPLAIMLLEKKCPLTKEVRWEWLNKIVLRGLVNIEKDDRPDKDQIRQGCLQLLRLLDCEESRQEFITLLCLALSRSLEKTGWRSQVFFLFTQALAILLPGEQAEVLLKLKNDFSLDQESLAQRILPVIKQASVEEAESILKKLIKTRKTKVKKSSKDIASKLSEIFKGETFYDPSAVESLFQLLIRGLTEDQIGEGWIKELITQAILYNTEHSLSLAARLFKHGCDKNLLEKEDLFQCGMSLLNSYYVLFFDPYYSLINRRKVYKNKEIIYGIVKRVFLLKRNFEDHKDIDVLLEFLTCFKNDAESYDIIFNLYCQYFLVIQDFNKKLHVEILCKLFEEHDEIHPGYQKLITIWKDKFLQKKNNDTIFTLLRAIQSKHKKESVKLICSFFTDPDKDKQRSLLLNLFEYLQYSDDDDDDNSSEISLDILCSFQEQIEQFNDKELIKRFNQLHIFLLIELPIIENFHKAFEIYRNKELSNKQEAISWLLFVIPTIDISHFNEEDANKFTFEMMECLFKEVSNGKIIKFDRKKSLSPLLNFKNFVSALNHFSKYDEEIISFLEFFLHYLIVSKTSLDDLGLEELLLKLIFQNGFSFKNYKEVYSLFGNIKRCKFLENFESLIYKKKVDEIDKSIFSIIRKLNDAEKEKYSRKEITRHTKQLEQLIEQMKKFMPLFESDWRPTGRLFIETFIQGILQIKSIKAISPALLYKFYKEYCVNVFQPKKEPTQKKNGKVNYEVESQKREILNRLFDALITHDDHDTLLLAQNAFSDLLSIKYDNQSKSYDNEMNELISRFYDLLIKCLFRPMLGEKDFDIQKLVDRWKIFLKLNKLNKSNINGAINMILQFQQYIQLVSFLLKDERKLKLLEMFNFDKEKAELFVKTVSSTLRTTNDVVQRQAKAFFETITSYEKKQIELLHKEPTQHYLCDLGLYFCQVQIEFLKLEKELAPSIDIDDVIKDIHKSLFDQFRKSLSKEKRKEYEKKASKIFK